MFDIYLHAMHSWSEILFSLAVERQDDSNSGGDLHENTTSNEANQNATHSSSPSGRNYRSVSDASAENVAFVIDNTSDRMSGGDPEAAVKLTALKEEDEAGDLKDITSDGLLRKLRRQFSKDSHGSCGNTCSLDSYSINNCVINNYSPKWR